MAVHDAAAVEVGFVEVHDAVFGAGCEGHELLLVGGLGVGAVAGAALLGGGFEGAG